MNLSDSHSDLASSFTDLMTSLAVIFILLLCYAHNQAQEVGEKSRDSILAELQKELKEFLQKGVKVESDPNDPLALLILVPEGLLEFKIDRAEIPSRGFDFLKAFIPKLANIICEKARFRNEISSIVVEGHTDSTGTDQYNWGLSQRRSMSVVAESIQVLDERSRITKDGINVRDFFVKLLSASGRGSAELIKDKGGLENKEMSRRVVFKIRVKSLEQRETIVKKLNT